MDRMLASRSLGAIVALVVAAAAPLPAQTPDPAATAYVDEAARVLVRRARERRETLDRSITS